MGKTRPISRKEKTVTKKEFSSYASVVVDLGIKKTLDYGIPSGMTITKNSIVEVPVRGRLCKGYVIEIKNQTPFSSISAIKKSLSSIPVLTEELYNLALWISSYYNTPLHKVLKTILPPEIRSAKQEKQQLFVKRNKSRNEIKKLCCELRNKNPSQALVLDVILPVKKGILLSELIEKAQVSTSPINTLVKKGVLSLKKMYIDRSPLADAEYFKNKPKKLNPEQNSALKKICSDIDHKHYATHLLYGVTGSGKTEIYIQAIEHALKYDLGAIILVPEIALTMQTIERFKMRFDQKIAIIHHRLSAGERFDQWQHILKGNCNIVVGARSALFAPIKNLGLIIVDEEHESSYKQNDSTPCYHARDVAVMRGKISKSTVILGSATPSLESFYNTTTRKYTLSTLRNRVEKTNLPHIHIVDMKKEYDKNGFTLFSDALLSGIEKRHKIGEQTILFLNRRGYHTTLLCSSCGYVMKCPNCDISLSFHHSDNNLSCHLCGYNLSPPPKQCPSCRKETNMKYKGCGTELVERSLKAIFPDVRTLRMDADTTRHKGSHDRLLRAFRSGKADVLIGTQMIAKGLHIPEVTLVGILNSDSSLNIPDFRSTEHTFQIITQVSGRAGRGSSPGEVIIQSCIPDNDTLKLATHQDFEKFYNQESIIRKHFSYPPFTRIVKIVFSGFDQTTTEKSAFEFYKCTCRALPKDFLINPIIPCGYAKIKNKFRFQFLIRGVNINTINNALDNVMRNFHFPKNVTIFRDVDPQSTFF